MLFTVNRETGGIDQLKDQPHADLDILEQKDLEEWVIQEPKLLGEDLLIISSQYSLFEDTRDRLDILALDSTGKLVVCELKRDRADRTTDLQGLKYASYCSNLTAEEIQKDYRTFWNGRPKKENLSPEDVGSTFSSFLSDTVDDEVPVTDEGWADFQLDDTPRIILVAGRYGTEVTSPVMWLVQEYGLYISCVEMIAYEHEGEIVLSSRQLVPPPEAEEYMTRRREKKQEQSEGLTETEKLYLEFWKTYRDLIQDQSDIRCTKPKPTSNINHRINMAGTYFSSVFSTYNSRKETFDTGELRVELVLSSDNDQADTIYDEIKERKKEIESKIDQKVHWSNPKDTKRKRIYIRRDANVKQKEKWEEYREWLLGNVEKFHNVFVPILKS